MIALCFLIFSCLIASALGRAGVDLSVATSLSDWQCLREKYSVDYAIIRLYRNIGLIDTNGAASLTNAAKAGINDLGAYMFPCLSESPYSKSHNVSCESVQAQADATIKNLISNNIAVADTILSPKDPVATVNRIWIDIEDEVPAKYFSADVTINQKFIGDLVEALEARGVMVGIYSTKTYWQNIMGNILGYSKYPLWYPRYDGVNSLDFFSPFCGWESVMIKQTAGDAYLCSISQVDTDYME